ncbi:MAG: hypothetical protein HRT66_10695 [Flavobacteriaceae bacterium]|nr:hypothetical protein [Flavobacteriaceae bacterium]
MNYTIKEIAEILEVSDKSVHRYLNSYFTKTTKGFEVSEKMLEILKNEHLDEPKDTVVQEFTNDEYEEFHKRLSEYSFLKTKINDILNELEYYKKSAKSHNRQMELMAKLI